MAGSFQFGSHRSTCTFISNGFTCYTFHFKGETRPRPITHHITCNFKDIICMVRYKRCQKRFIGKTKRPLKDRFNEHRRRIDNYFQISSFPSKSVSFHYIRSVRYHCSNPLNFYFSCNELESESNNLQHPDEYGSVFVF